MLANYDNPEYHFFASKHFVIFAVLYVAVNLTICIAGTNSSSLEMNFVTSSIAKITFFAPILIAVIPDMAERCRRYISKRPNIVKEVADIVSTIMIIAFCVFATGYLMLIGINAINDALSEPQYRTGVVESITPQYKSFTVIVLEGDANRYEYGTFGVDAHIGGKYKFRYMVKSKTLYPVEKT